MYVKKGRKRYEVVYQSHDRWLEDAEEYAIAHEYVDRSSYTEIVDVLIGHYLFWYLKDLNGESVDKHEDDLIEAVKSLYEELYGGAMTLYPIAELVDEDFQLYDEFSCISADEAKYDPREDALTFPVVENGTIVMSLKEFYDMGGELEMHIDYGAAKVIDIEGCSAFYGFHFLSVSKIKKCRAKRLRELKALNKIYAAYDWKQIEMR